MLEKDREEWFHFVETMERETSSRAVLVVPYGEALVHEYYWEGLAGLSKQSGVQAVGAQSNFSFPVGHMLECYERLGGRLDKLRLWGTFHPGMTTVDAFLNQCFLLAERGLSFCVGGVGMPEYIELYRKLRAGLPEEVYFWLNKMDGMERNYTDGEKAAFSELDEFFELELRAFPADASQCGDSVMIQGDGTIRPCVLCHTKMGNLYTGGFGQLSEKKCTAKACDCYLSYNNRDDIERLVSFQPEPAFRIRNRIKWNEKG